MPNFRVFSVEEAAPRLDLYLRTTIPGLSRRRARELCENSQVRVNGRSARPGLSLVIGDRIEVAEGFERVVQARAELALREKVNPDIVYEDEVLLAVVKPREQHTVTLRVEDSLTLADVLAAYSSKCFRASPDARESGLVQRLDFYTSGLLIGAKERKVWKKLRKMMLFSEITKNYLALVEGLPVESRFTISFPLCQSHDPARMELAEIGARSVHRVFPAHTEVEVLATYLDAKGQQISLVRARGRRVHRHQIRLHLAAVGHPLVGDDNYGAKSDSCLLPSGENIRGFFLHAESVSLNHPVSGDLLELVSSPKQVQSLTNGR